MHIAINANFFQQPNTGSGQYLRGLLAGLETTAPQVRISLIHPPPRRLSNLAKLWFEQATVPLTAWRMGADLLHVPYFAPPWFSPIPVVVSILDVIPLVLPAYRGRVAVRSYMRLVASAAGRAAHVVAISQASQQDITRVLHIPSQRISVTPLAAGTQYAPGDRLAARAEVAARYGISARFVYYVGGLDERKNVATLIRGFAAMRRAGGPEVILVIAGRALGNDPILFPDIDAVIAAEGAQPWVQRIDVPTSDNPLLYRAAELFAAPSCYEGFGLGPLEAMACGTPVIAANASSTPEVVGDAAILVDPTDPSAWAAALRQALDDPALQSELRMRGLARAAQFSYRDTAVGILAVYRRVAGAAAD